MNAGIASLHHNAQHALLLINLLFVMLMYGCVHVCAWIGVGVCVHVEAGSQFWVSSPGKLPTAFETEHVTGLEFSSEAGWAGHRPEPQKASWLCLSKSWDSENAPPCPPFSPGLQRLGRSLHLLATHLPSEPPAQPLCVTYSAPREGAS